jgi:hypothetical protein
MVGKKEGRKEGRGFPIKEMEEKMLQNKHKMIRKRAGTRPKI